MRDTTTVFFFNKNFSRALFARARCSEGYRSSERTLPPSRIDLHVLISDGRARRERRRGRTKRRNKKSYSRRNTCERALDSVLFFVSDLRPAVPSSQHPPIRPCIHLVHGVSMAGYTTTPLDPLLPVRASRRRAKRRRDARVSSANNLKLNLTGLSPFSPLCLSPVSPFCRASRPCPSSVALSI